MTFIGISLYNVVILCLIGVPVALMMKDEVDACYTLISIFIFFATTLTICLVFIPKVKVTLRHARTHICLHTRTHTHAHIHLYTRTYTHIYTHSHTCRHIHARTPARTHKYTCTDTHIHMHIDAHTHARTHARTHAQSRTMLKITLYRRLSNNVWYLSSQQTTNNE